jgi:hypothetical protein
MGVVDHQRHRPVIGQICHQPIETMQRGNARRIPRDWPRLELRVLEQGPGEPGRPRKRRLALGLTEIGQRLLQQLAHQAKGKARLELRSPRHEHPQPRPVGQPAGRLE